MDVKSNIQANADKAAKNTVNKLDESKRIVNNFRSKTNKRLQRIQSQQSLHQQQKQSQLKQNLKLLLNQSVDYDQVSLEGAREFNKTFSGVFEPKRNHIQAPMTRSESRKKMLKLNAIMDKKSRMAVIDSSPFWERGLNDDNKLKDSERKELFVAIRKWNMMQSRNNIIQSPSPKKKRITIIRHGK